MPNEDDRLDSLANIKALETEFDFIDKRLLKIQETLKSFDSNTTFAKTFGSGGAPKAGEDFETTTRKARTAVDELTQAQKKLAASQTNTAKQVAALNVQTQQQNKANKDAALAVITQTDAYKELERNARNATATAKALAASTTATAKEQTDAATKAKALNDQLKAIDKTVGLNQRNVGNYSESFSVLEAELVRVTKKLADLKTAQGGVQDLTKRNPIGFQRSGDSGTTAQFGFQTSSQTAEIHKLEQQEKALQLATNNASKGFTNLTQELKVNERTLQTLRAAGLADTDAFKKLQDQTNHTRKEFNDFAKQQKILSSDLPALTGLTVAAKGLAGTYAVGAGAAAIFGDENGKIEKEVAKLIAIMTVLNGLQEAHELLEQKDAIATALNTAAQKAYAFAVGESVGAMKAFRIALALTGLGLLLITLGYIIVNFKELFTVVDPVVKGIDDLKDVTKESKDALKAYGDTAEKITQGVMKDLKEQTKSLNDELKKTPDALEKGAILLQVYQNRIAGLKTESDKLKKTKILNEDDIVFIAENDAEIKKLSKTVKELTKDYAEAARVKQIFERNEFRKAVAETFIQAIKDGQDANNRIINNSRSTYSQRTAALAAFYKAEDIINRKQYEIDENEAGESQAKRAAAESKFNSAQLKARRDALEKQRDLDRQFEETNRGAKTASQERALQDNIDTNKSIADDETQLGDIRIKALQNVLEKQEKLFQLQEKEELHQVAITGNNEEKKKDIRNKYDTLRTNAAKAEGDAIFKILVQNAQRELTLAEQTAAELKNVSHDSSRDHKEINNTTANDFINAINAGLPLADANLKKLAFTGDKFSQVLTHLIPIQAGEKVDEYVEKIKAIGAALKQLGSEAVGAVFDIFTNKIERQKNAIQDSIDALDVKKAKDIEIVEQTIGDEEKKADAIANINIRTDAQKVLLQKKQRDLDIRKAQFDKASTISGIILNTALGITSALTSKPPNIILAGVVGAIGLVSAARAAAAPIPKYAQGGTHEGGLMIAGDAYRSEAMITPDGLVYKSAAIPTVYDMPAKTKILPDFNRMVLKNLMYVNEHGKLIDTTGAIKKIGREIVEAVRTKQTNHFYGMPRHRLMTQDGNSFRKYLNMHGV